MCKQMAQPSIFLRITILTLHSLLPLLFLPTLHPLSHFTHPPPLPLLSPSPPTIPLSLRSDDVFFLQMMFVRKGKRLLGRMLPLLDEVLLWGKEEEGEGGGKWGKKEEGEGGLAC